MHPESRALWGVFSTACDSPSITSTVSKKRSFSFIFNGGNKRKVGWLEDDSHVVFGQKVPSEEGSMRNALS
jgi:hypothetical protein